MDQVSVIIPTYNRAELLVRALESVIHQDDFEGEIVVIDDGSTDSTRELLEKYIKRYGVIYRYIVNSGPAKARNIGVDLASHSLIAFLDSDDHWKRDKLKKQTRLLKENPQFRICHTGEKWLRRGKHLNQKKIHIPRHGDIFNHCVVLCAVGFSTVLMEKSLYHEFSGLDTSMPCCEDYDFWLRISSSYQFLLHPEQLTIKEGGRPDQLSMQFRIGIDKYRIYALKKFLDNYRSDHDRRKIVVDELQRKCKVYGRGCMKHGKTEEGEYYSSLSEKYSY